MGRLIEIRPLPRRRQRLLARWMLIAAIVCIGCDGPQSALQPAGRGAEEIARLFWVMVVGAAVVWCVVVGLAVYAIRIAPRPHDAKLSRRWVIGGGAAAPTLILTALLLYGLSMLPDLLRPAPAGSLQIDVTGARWWWRVEYAPDQENSTVLANEIRLPVGQVVQFHLNSADVIHAFWIPSLGGKVDMIPGRSTRLTLEPTKTGRYRGVCAEFCGASHAHMAFDVVVMEQDEFDRWLDAQRRPALEPASPQAMRGQRVFRQRGCGACHAISGTTAEGAVAPDLTHVGSRLSLAAGTLPNTVENLGRWISNPKAVKPEAVMPRFDMLTDDDLEALAVYLKGLE